MHRFIKLNMKIPLCPPQKGDTFAQWEKKRPKKKRHVFTQHCGQEKWLRAVAKTYSSHSCLILGLKQNLQGNSHNNNNTKKKNKTLLHSAKKNKKNNPESAEESTVRPSESVCLTQLFTIKEFVQEHPARHNPSSILLHFHTTGTSLTAQGQCSKAGIQTTHLSLIHI